MSHHALPSWRPVCIAARLVSVIMLLGVAAGLPAQHPRAREAAAGAALFARALDQIKQLYIEPITDRQVAVSGAARLSRLDNKLVVAPAFGRPSADSLIVSYDGHDVTFVATPGDNDAQKWGELLAGLIATAKQASPQIAALPQEKIERAVFHGMTAALDGYSRYSSPEAASDQRAARDGFGGIGVTVDTSDHLLRVAAVSPHSPAASAGIKPEDQIVAINGIATAGCSQEDAMHQLRGPIGSPIALRVLHTGPAELRDVRLQRAFVTEPTVTLSRLASPQGDIAVLQVSSFNRSTSQRVAEAVAQARRQAGGRLAGIVLDLRGNPGGLLDQAVSLADLFIHDGPIVATRGRHPASQQYFAAKGDSIAPRVPMAVLINGGSASASEIVAAALQDAGRAVAIGSSSYGKGTVQTVLRLANNGELIVTWARLVARSGYLLQHHGVVPTMCTALLPDDGGPIEVRLQQAAAVSFAVGPRSRAALDERAWSLLRGSCPPRRTRPALDLKLAERLLANPALYAQALHALPAATQVAAQTAAPRLP